MEKFEYAILDKQYVGDMKCFVFQGKILNPRIDYLYKKIKYVDAFNILGEEGWELILKEESKCVFKRKKIIEEKKVIEKKEEKIKIKI